MELASTGRAEDVLLNLRVRSLFSPYFFVKIVLGYSKLTDYLHQHDMELFVKRLLQGHCKQWIEWPRGFYKTTTFTLGCGMWFALPFNERDTDYALSKLKLPEEEWFARLSLHDRNSTQLYAFETIDNAKKKVGQVKWHYEANELFRSCFSETAYDGSESPWNSECIKIRREGYGERVQEGTFEAIGVGGALQSRHYTIVWEDDLVGKKARDSQTEMQKTIDWHGLLHGAFEDATRQMRFGVSNQWGFSDLNHWVRANEPDFIFYSRSSKEFDEETGEERAIFPVDGQGQQAFTLEALSRLEHGGGMNKYDFACQYMNRAITPGDQEVDLAKIHYFTVDDTGKMQCSCGVSWFPSQCNRYMHYDPYNAKGAGSTSCPAIVVVACAPDKHVFWLDLYMGRGSYGKVFDHVFRMNTTWKPVLMTYEDVGHQNMTAFYIRQFQNSKDFADTKWAPVKRIEGVGTHGVPKEIRIRERLFPLVEAGRLSLRKKHSIVVEMMETFPHRVPGHDYDALDAAEDGADFWRFPQPEELSRELEEGAAEYERQLGQPYSCMVSAG